jgi:hypothetical protein
MESFKYSIGDVFALPFDTNAVTLNAQSKGNNTINFVLYVSNELLLTLQNHIDTNGNVLDNWQVISFDLTNKKSLELLDLQKYQSLPTTKFGTLGTSLMYGEDDYVLGGITLKSLGSMTFKKPLLVKVYKIAEEVTMDVESGSTNYQSTLMRIWDSCTKIPLESDKNLLLVVIEEPKSPIKKYSKIEISVDSNDNNDSDKLLPPLRNVIGSDISYRDNFPPNANLIGMGLFRAITHSYNYNEVLFSAISLPFERSGRVERNSVRISGLEGFTNTTGANVYVMSEGEYIFPNWRLQTDSVLYTGIGLEDKGKYSNVLGKVLIMPENFRENRFGTLSSTVGGVYDVKKYENDIMLFHPQIFLGGNVKFKENKDDLFLILGNQPLAGSRGRGTHAVWRKTIGSTQFPIKTRAQLSKINKVPIEQQITLNKAFYEYDKGYLPSSTYFPKSYAPLLKVNYPNLMEGTWNVSNDAKVELNWTAFNALGKVSANMPNQNIEKILEYFDYENLNEIQSKNPLLYEKLVYLINKSIDIYFKNLPSKQSNTTISPRSYLRFEFYKFKIVLRALSVRTFFEYDRTLIFDGKGGGNYWNNIFKDGDNLKYESSLIAIVHSMQQVAVANLSAYGHPYLTFEEIEYFKPIIWDKYLYPIQLLLSEEDNNFLEVNFHNRIYSFASNYFAFQELDNSNGDFLNVAPVLKITVNEVERWSNSILSNIKFGMFELTLNVDVASPEEMLKTKALFAKMAMLCLENMDTLLRVNSLSSLMRLFSYYEVVGKKVSEVSIKDLHHDIRFKYLLLETSIKGIFTEKTIAPLIAFLKEMSAIVQDLFDIYKDNKFKRINVRLDLPEYLVDWESMDVNTQYLVGNFENSFYGSSTQTSVNNAATLLMTYIYEEKLTEMIELMKENEFVAKLLTEETTPKAEWLKMFGADSVVVNTIEEEETIEPIEPTEPIEPLRVIEPTIIDEPLIEDDEDDEEDFDFDSLNIDDIAIDLSDDDILETNIDI